MTPLQPRSSSTKLVATAVIRMLVGACGFPSPVAAQESAPDVAARLNSTGRKIVMPVPFKDGPQSLGEIVVTIAANDAVLVTKAGLAELLAKTLTAAELQRLKDLPDEAGNLPIAALQAAGFEIRFDPGLLELVLEPHVDQRAPGDISLAPPRTPASDVTTETPAAFSGFLNIRATADYVLGSESGREGLDGTRFDLDAVLRFGGAVIENETTYEADGDTDRDVYGRRYYWFQQDGLKRRGTRVVYDLPDSLIRIQAGDSRTLATTFQRSNDVLGLAVEKSPRKLSPDESIRPTGRRSFKIEQTSEVDVLVNGAIVQSLRLRPGTYNLSDLPLRSGSNEVELVIRDGSGRQEVLRFTAFSDQNLLARGVSEWLATAGVPSYLRDGEVTYLEDTWYSSGFYRLGLSDELTAEIKAQADNLVATGGLGAELASPIGLLSMNAAVSKHSDLGFGAAVGLAWQLVNFRGLTGKPETLRLDSEYRSPYFAMAGESARHAEIMLRDPRQYYYEPYRLRLSGSYSFPITDKINGTISGRYQFSNDARRDLELENYRVYGDRYGVDVSMSSTLNSYASIALTAGYTNETQSHSNFIRQDDPELRVGVRLHLRPDHRTSVSAGYDSFDNRSYLSASRRGGEGLEHWDASVSVNHADADERLAASGSIAYQGARGEVRLTHSGVADGISYRNPGVSRTDQRTSLQAGAAVAFANGHIAVGAPIHGNGFAIVAPHESIAGREITVGSESQPRGRSDWLGPALVSDVAAYTHTTLPVDVADLPVGYSLGSGAFELNAPYRAGYVLQVGSGYAVSAFGSLLDGDGAPVALLTGFAQPIGNPNRKVTVFTNAAGRFAAEGLSPGRWTIEMATEPTPTRFLIDIPEGTEGLYKAGNLKPMKSS